MTTQEKLGFAICGVAMLIITVVLVYIFWPSNTTQPIDTTQQAKIDQQEAQQVEADRKAIEAKRQAQREAEEREKAQAARARALADEEARARSKMVERGKVYASYLNKTQEFYELLLRTTSDLEVGMNYADFTVRLRDLNWKLKKWDESLNSEEKKFLSSRLMRLAFFSYEMSLMWWKNKINDEYASVKAMDEALMQDEWHTAGAALKMAKTSLDGKDLLTDLPCLLCDNGKKLCIPCSIKNTKDPSCKICKGQGYCACPWCNGTLKVSQSSWAGN
jgi:hypothetical protein